MALISDDAVISHSARHTHFAASSCRQSSGVVVSLTADCSTSTLQADSQIVDKVTDHTYGETAPVKDEVQQDQATVQSADSPPVSSDTNAAADAAFVTRPKRGWRGFFRFRPDNNRFL